MDTNPLPERRTTSAEDRAVLAAERTFAAWLRTGPAFLASGLAAQQAPHGAARGWEPRLLATAPGSRAAARFRVGAPRDARVRERLSAPNIRLPPRVLTLGASALPIAASVPAAALIRLRWPPQPTVTRTRCQAALR